LLLEKNNRENIIKSQRYMIHLIVISMFPSQGKDLENGVTHAQEINVSQLPV
jgi:hypothetical protein